VRVFAYPDGQQYAHMNGNEPVPINDDTEIWVRSMDGALNKVRGTIGGLQYVVFDDRVQAVKLALSDFSLYMASVVLTDQQQRTFDALTAAVEGLDAPEAKIRRALDEAAGNSGRGE
jgi:hypothetical protein